jgi:hypothetical protein
MKYIYRDLNTKHKHDSHYFELQFNIWDDPQKLAFLILHMVRGTYTEQYSLNILLNIIPDNV